MTPQQFKALQPPESPVFKQSPKEDHGFANTTGDSDKLNYVRHSLEFSSTFEPADSGAKIDTGMQDFVDVPPRTQAEQLRGNMIDDMAHSNAHDQTALGETGSDDTEAMHEQSIVAGEAGGRINGDICAQVNPICVSFEGRHAQSHPASPSDISDNEHSLEGSAGKPAYLEQTPMGPHRDEPSSLKRQLHECSGNLSGDREVLNRDGIPVESDGYNSAITNKRARYGSDLELHAQRQNKSYNDDIDSLFYEQTDTPVANSPTKHKNYDYRMSHRRNSNTGNENDESMIDQNQTALSPSHNYRAVLLHGANSNTRDEDDESMIGQDQTPFFPSDNHYNTVIHGRGSTTSEEDEYTIDQDQTHFIPLCNHPNSNAKEKDNESIYGRNRTSFLHPWNRLNSDIRYEDNESMAGEDQTAFRPSHRYRISNTRDEDNGAIIGQDQTSFLPPRNYSNPNNRYEGDESMMGQGETPFLPSRNYHTIKPHVPYSDTGRSRLDLREDNTPFGRNPPRAARRVQSYAEEYNENDEDEDGDELYLQQPAQVSSGISRGSRPKSRQTGCPVRQNRTKTSPVDSPLSQTDRNVRAWGVRPAIGTPQLGVNSHHPESNFFEDDPESSPRKSTHRASTGHHVGFHVPGGLGSNLAARDSGYKINKSTLNLPPDRDMVDQATFSDATLRKRGISRTGAPTISRRAHGANDPENILIVNMVENENASWATVADTLNKNRISTGRNPTFTANSVHNRYNRNAPLLFAAEGKQWTSIKKRNSTTPSQAVPTSWTPELDLVLIETVQAVDQTRWGRVAAEFNNRTGQEIDADSAALRHRLI